MPCLLYTSPLLDGADYAIVPIMAQVEYPANGSTLDLVLPDSVTLLDYYGAPAEDAESLLHNEYLSLIHIWSLLPKTVRATLPL